MRPADSAAPAEWIVRSIHPFAQDVGAIVPEGFEAYSRVFHPAGRYRDLPSYRSVTWAEIARANGKEVHAEMQFEFLVPSECFDHAKNCRSTQAGLWDAPPTEGELDGDLAGELSRLLSRHTSSPSLCYFAYWNGWGDSTLAMPPPTTADERNRQIEILRSYETGDVFRGTPRGMRDEAATFSIPGRDFFLFEGDLAEATTGWSSDDDQCASMWWPADRSWCVATEIDFDSTYVGGSKDCTDALLDDASLEALNTSVHDRIGRPADRINQFDGR